MADKEPGRTKSRASGRRGGRRAALGGCALLGGALAGLVALRYGGVLALCPPLRPSVPSPVIALGAVGVVCYTMFFLVCEAALLVLAILNIQDEKMHNKYRSLMLLVLYVFTFRYRRVLPAKFFGEAGDVGAKSAKTAKTASAGGGPRKAGKHRHKRGESTMGAESPPPPPPPSPPSYPSATDEEIRAAFALLLTHMAATLGDKEAEGAEDTKGPAAGHAVADTPAHPGE